MIQINWFQKLISYLVLIVFAVLIISCGSVRPSHQGTNPSSAYHKGIAAYFVNDSVEQFFIKPIQFKSKETSLKLASDFTIRSGDESNWVDTKFSIFSKEKLNFDEFSQFYFGDIPLQNAKLMYTQQHKKNKFEMRVSGQLNKVKFAKLPVDAFWKTTKNKSIINFLPKRKSQKVMQSFSDEWIY